jgi:UPF0176 protein
MINPVCWKRFFDIMDPLRNIPGVYNVSFLNLSGYHFKPLANLEVIRNTFLQKSDHLNIKGTVLLAPEGINLFLSGSTEDCESFLDNVCSALHISSSDLELKPSWSDKIAFNRFLVRLKKEIIAFDYEFNHENQSPYVSANELDSWLAQSPEDVVLLDTRNRYETKFGTFVNAIVPAIDTFKEFKPFVDTIGDLKNKKIVTFCTGGIRCEKAATFLKEQGFEEVYQLKGGILKYFEETSATNYDGECFVFDKRVSLKPDLSISDKSVCFACRSPLTAEDCAHEHYLVGLSCPYCFEEE